jgi:uncharacterized membrane protein YvbJ
MKKIIHRLRNRSEAERRHILHIITIAAAIIMIILWSFSLGKSFSNPQTKEKVKQDLQPFSMLKDSL